MFRAAKQHHLYQDTLKQIEDAILRGDLKPGEKLPSERELRETMLISRATLREALRGLEQKGLIEIKLGVKGGSYIKEIGVDQVSGKLDLLIRHKKVSLKSLYEFREGVEGIAASLATERATDEDFVVLDKVLEQAHEEIEKDGEHWKTFYELESQLHQLMAQISGNPIYEIIFSAIHTNINSYSHLLPRNKEVLQSFYLEWKTIINHMHKREVTKVNLLTKTHAVRANEFARKASSRHGQIMSDIILKI
jgi:DNA-binding FadR family transcriptional regulator